MKHVLTWIMITALTAFIFAVAGMQFEETERLHARLDHIETALGINPETPDGQMYSSFLSLRDALIHLHEKELVPMYEALEPLMRDRDRETIRPLTKEKEQIETGLESTQY